jgi:hypothetical protein
MYEHPTSTIQAFLDEPIGCREILQQILVFDIVHVYQQMLVRLE